MKKSLPISFLLFLFILSVKVCSQSITWTETKPAGDANKNWLTTSMSSDGSTLIAGVSWGRLYISTNSGSNWTETRPADDANKNWHTTSMSSDGDTLIAGVYEGRLYISTNGGSNWTETQPALNADNYWRTTSMSSDGTKLIAGVEGGRLYISTNGGSIWTETTPAGAADKWWYTTSMSSDGSKLIAGVYPGRLYISTNGGSSWTETYPAGEANKDWRTTSMSSDGSTLIAGAWNSRLYISTNSGSSWTETYPAGEANKSWNTTSMSSDGSTLIAGVDYGRLYISTNGGSSWTQTQPAGAADKYWSTTSMSSDGSKAIVAVYTGRLYLNNEPLPVELASFTAQVNSNIVTLYWQTATEVNNYGFEIESSVGSKQTAVSAWEKIGFVNGHGNSNSPKDYSFVDDKVASFGKYCYRLKQIDTDGSFEYSDIVEADFGQPNKFELMQNYPNPFNPATKISYTVPQDSKVRLTLFNTLGQEIAVLEEGFKEAGFYNYQLSIDNYQLQSGVYFYKLEAGSFAQVKKMIIAK